MGLLDLIAAPSPERAKQTLADLVRGPQNRLRGLLDSPVSFLTDALNDVVPTGQQAAEQLQRYQLPMSQDYAMGPSGYDNKLKDMALAGLTVYHGSPHKFDKFDINKIGTGEGAQAYGHGLYFAESPDVANSYVQSVVANSDELAKRGASHGLPADVASNLIAAKQSGKNFDAMIDAAKKAADNPLLPQSQKLAARRLVDHEMQAYNAWSDWSKPGSLYKVDLPDESIAKMLDWDKPLSQQAPEVQKVVQDKLAQLEKLRYANPVYSMQHKQLSRGDMTGQDLFRFLGDGGKGQKSMDMWKSAGIPGIRYLDGSSRSAGSGTSNYVVFDDSLLKILERNGMPVP